MKLRKGRMSDKKAQELIRQLQAAAEAGPDAYDAWRSALPYDPVAIEFPSGEITEKYFAENAGGFLFAWKLQGAFQNLPIDDKDRFNAQGIEGKIRVETGLVVALLVYAELREHRRQIIIL